MKLSSKGSSHTCHRLRAVPTSIPHTQHQCHPLPLSLPAAAGRGTLQPARHRATQDPVLQAAAEPSPSCKTSPTALGSRGLSYPSCSHPRLCIALAWAPVRRCWALAWAQQRTSEEPSGRAGPQHRSCVLAPEGPAWHGRTQAAGAGAQRASTKRHRAGKKGDKGRRAVLGLQGAGWGMARATSMPECGGSSSARRCCDPSQRHSGGWIWCGEKPPGSGGGLASTQTPAPHRERLGSYH